MTMPARMSHALRRAKAAASMRVCAGALIEPHSGRATLHSKEQQQPGSARPAPPGAADRAAWTLENLMQHAGILAGHA
ncbi:hypothetical protein G6F68_017987 [Rhizopus microsporus]|nr:hypothetical protein G6F68_017987 [Rhizopus microsporus]